MTRKRKKPEPKSDTLAVRVSHPVAEAVRDAAESAGVRESDWLRQAIALRLAALDAR